MPEQPDREKRRTVVCRTQAALRKWETGKERQATCDTPLVPQPVFFVPEEGPVVRVDNSRPEGIVLFNLETTINCDEVYESSQGSPVTIGYGQYLYNISYSDIPNITDTQLFRIAELDQTSINAALSEADFSVISEMGLSATQQSFLVDRVAEGIENLTIAVREVAIGLLRCNFLSEEKTFCCPTGLFIRQGSERDECITIPAGFRSSELSISAANAKVDTEGNSRLLQCVTGNEKIVVTCPEEFYIGESSGVSIVEEDTFFASSLSLANEQAVELAYRNLECFLCNEEIVVSCPSGSVTPDLVIAAGVICRNSPGELELAISEAILNAEACLYENKETRCSCNELDPSYDYTEEYGNTSYTAVVTKGEFSGESQVEVDRQAKDECVARLDCQWCSNAIPGCSTPFDSTRKRFYMTYEEATKVMNDIRNGTDTNDEPIVDYFGANQQSLGQYIDETYTEFTNKIKDFQDAGVDIPYYMTIAMSNNTPWWWRHKKDINGRYITGGVSPVQPFCKVQSPISKEEATREAMMISELPDCRKPCGEGRVCQTEEEARANGTVDFGDICDSEADSKGNVTLSYCVPDSNGGGGGGGGGGKKPKPECQKGCTCMTEADAIKRFGRDNYEFCKRGLRAKPCGVNPGLKEVGKRAEVKYCFKSKKKNQDGGGGGGAGTTPDKEASCPPPCICIESAGIWESENPEKKLVDCSASTALSCGVNDIGMCFEPQDKSPNSCPDGCTCIHDINYFDYEEKYHIAECKSDTITFHCAGEGTRSECWQLTKKDDTSPGICPPGCTCGDFDVLQALHPDKDIVDCGDTQCTPMDQFGSGAGQCYSIEDKYPDDDNDNPPDDYEEDGGTGQLIWENCEGVRTVLLNWVNGIITTNGDSVFIAGCTPTETPTDTPP